MPEKTIHGNSAPAFSSNDDRRPIPDPTVLTTQQLLREIQSARELTDSRFESMDKAIALLQALADKSPSIGEVYIKHEEKFASIETKFADRDKAIELVRSVASAQAETVATAVKSLQRLHDERFNSIQLQFSERDTRAEQTRTEGKVSIDAALQAAKEAVSEQNKSNGLAIAKSEASTTKQIDQIGQLIASGQKGTDDKIEDIKERVTKIEANKQGATEIKQGTASNWGLLFGAVGMFVGLIGIIFAIAVFFKH